MPILPGTPAPLGATPRRDGTAFAVMSPGDVVTLCLFDAAGTETRLVLPERDGDVRHGFVPGIGPGQRYGYRVEGPYDPRRGARFDPEKLLLDPYSRAIVGEVSFEPAVFGHGNGDSAPYAPRSLVVAPGNRPGPGPRHALADTVIYEVHVKGFTMRHPDVPPELRGTYSGMAHPAALNHLRTLGVTAIELLPVHQHLAEPFLIRRHLTNYWGYNTIGFFAPHNGYSAAVRAGTPGGQVQEFRDMVAALHQAGFDVLLDVVFNHTAEVGPDGPTLCHRGLYDGAYYRLDATGGYIDTTGCGNSLNARHPVALQMVMDSLRYWVTEMGVDGFRFDLAPTLGRQDGDFDAASAFFDIVAQDPVVSTVKLIAEPWDVGRMDSYDIGRFPPLWSEWNGRYRDTVRDFWRSHEGLLGEFAERICGSADLYAAAGRRPSASVNIVTVHDGFTLRDLVSYTKHNEANTEGNRDGSDDNRSWNCGAEGATTDPDILALRARQTRAILATLLLSAGVPLLLGGDEIGRTQQGNNNAYCQDNQLTWFDWDNADRDLLAFTRTLIQLRRDHPVFRRRRYRTGADASDLRWFTPAGTPMTDTDWGDPSARSIALLVDGATDPDLAADGTRLVDDDHLVLVNAGWEPVTFTVPAGPWEIVCDTFAPNRAEERVHAITSSNPRSVMVLRRVPPP